MRLLIYLLMSLMICPFVALLAPSAPPPTLTPTVTPAAPTVSSPHINISATAVTLNVGDTVTISGEPVNIGLPYYTLTLTSGASVTVTYGNEVRTLTSDSLFEIVEARAEMSLVIITLRALAPGSAEATISATGEVRTAEGAFMWGGGSSEPLTLTVTG